MKLSELVRKDRKQLKRELRHQKRKNAIRPEEQDDMIGDGEGDMSTQATSYMGGLNAPSR